MFALLKSKPKTLNPITEPTKNSGIANMENRGKGGDGGRKTANMLQFKINPAELIDLI